MLQTGAAGLLIAYGGIWVHQQDVVMHRASNKLRIAASATLCLRCGVTVKCGRIHARQHQLHLDRSAGVLT